MRCPDAAVLRQLIQFGGWTEKIYSYTRAKLFPRVKSTKRWRRLRRRKKCESMSRVENGWLIKRTGIPFLASLGALFVPPILPSTPAHRFTKSLRLYSSFFLFFLLLRGFYSFPFSTLPSFYFFLFPTYLLRSFSSSVQLAPVCLSLYLGRFCIADFTWKYVFSVCVSTSPKSIFCTAQTKWSTRVLQCHYIVSSLCHPGRRNTNRYIKPLTSAQINASQRIIVIRILRIMNILL